MHTHRFYRATAFLIAIALCVPLLLQLPRATAAETQTITYEKSEVLFPNPERGLSIMMGHTGVSELPYPFSDYLNYFETFRQNYGSSTVAISYYIGEWKYTDLPQSFLDRMEEDFATAREHGYKVYPHFHYSYTWSWPPTDAESEKDASKERIISHLQQMKPIFAENGDIIVFLWPGMIGHYGEWWGSLNDNIGPKGQVNDNTRAIIEAMLDATPPDRMMVTRYRATKTSYFEDMVTLDPNTAWNNTARARIGFENQCFMADDDGETGTYKNGGTSGPWSYMNEESKYVPLVGFPDSDCGDGTATVSEMKTEMEASNWDLFGSPPHEILGLDENDPQVLEVIKNMGYRYRLVSTELPTSATAGSSVPLTLEITNDGSGSIFNPRDIDIVFRNTNTGDMFTHSVVADDRGNRTYFPHPNTTKTWEIEAILPANMSTSTYEVLLHLPDPYESIRNRAEYSIRLANQNVWEAETGYNKLNATLEVTSGTLDVPSVTSFTLIDADTDEAIQEVQDGETLDLSTLNTANLSIRANTEPATVGSVQFFLDEELIKTENYAPYAIAGDADQGQDYLPWQFPVSGQHTLTAIPYSATQGKGDQGLPLAVDITLINGNTKENFSAVAETRDPWLWPFAQDSIWNTPIGSDAVYAPANFEPNATLGGDNVYLLQLDNANPARPVYGHNSWGPGRCTGSSLDFDWNIPDDFIVPDSGEENPDGLTPNNPFAFLLPDGNTVFEAQVLARCEPDGPVYIPSWLTVGDNLERSRRDIYGDGIDGQSENYGGSGHGASGMSALGGTIRKGELTNDTPIRHPIKLTMWAKKYLYYNEADATPGYRWPATDADNHAGDPNSPKRYQGTNPDIEMGTLLAIPPNVTAEDLGLHTDPAKKLFAAMQDYGIYIVEDSAWDNALLVWEKGVEEELNAIGINPRSKDDPFFQDVNTLFEALYIVTNNGPDSIGGGGTPRAPLAPPFADPS